MNIKPVNDLSRMENKTMNVAALTHSIKEDTFTLSILQEKRFTIDEIDDAYAVIEINAAISIKSICIDRNISAEQKISKILDELQVFFDARAKRVGLEAMDDECQTKGYHYITAIAGYCEKAHGTLKAIISGYELLKQSIAEYFKSKKTKRRSA